MCKRKGEELSHTQGKRNAKDMNVSPKALLISQEPSLLQCKWLMDCRLWMDRRTWLDHARALLPNPQLRIVRRWTATRLISLIMIDERYVT
jgi:hypothetical protein